MNPFFNPLTRRMDVGPEAGENVSVTGNTVNFIGGGTEGAVYNAGAGLTLEGNVFTANVAAVGFGMELSGGTASYARYRNIETVTGSIVTLMAGHAYKIYATSAAITINTETIPSNMYGQEGHIEIFVAGTGYVQTGANVVLANALEPDAVNNCTVRFHDGLAIISVEDHVAGYIVVSATGSTAGTLPYALGSASQEYVAFDAALNGQTLDMGGATTNGEKHIVGNGYSDTILTGGVSCISKTTFANLAMSGASVTGGTMILGDVYIPSGATVAVSGGGLAIKKVSGNGGVIDLGGKHIYVTGVSSAYASGCTFTGGTDILWGGGVFVNVGHADLIDVVISGCTANVGGGLAVSNGHGAAASSGTVAVTGGTITGNFASGGFGGGLGVVGGIAYVSSSVISGNSATFGARDVNVVSGGFAFFKDCTLGNCMITGGGIALAGANTIDTITSRSDSRFGSVTISSGAIIDLTGNTNAVPIKPGGGVTFAPGGATVYPFAGSASAYTLGGMTVPQIGNTVDVNLGGTNLAPSDGGFAKNVRFTSMAAATAVEAVMDTNISFDGCEFVNPGSATTIAARTRAIINLSDCALNSCSLKVGNSGAFVFAGSNTFTGKFVDQDSGGVIISSGAVLDLTGNANTAPIYPGGGITLYGGVLNQPTTIIYSSGGNVGSRTFEDLEIQGATITKLGLVYGATVYSLAGDDHEIIYTEDNGATSSSVFISGETVYVVPGALMKVANT